MNRSKSSFKIQKGSLQKSYQSPGNDDLSEVQRWCGRTMVNTEDDDNELQNEQRGECGCCLGQFSDSHHLSVLSRKKSVFFCVVWGCGALQYAIFFCQHALVHCGPHKCRQDYKFPHISTLNKWTSLAFLNDLLGLKDECVFRMNASYTSLIDLIDNWYAMLKSHVNHAKWQRLQF